MATILSNNPTLHDLAKMTKPDGTILKTINLMSQQNGIMDDITTFQEANNGTTNLVSMITGLPDVSFSKLYKYTQPATGERAQVTEGSGFIRSFSVVDVEAAQCSGNVKLYRHQEDMMHVEAIQQKIAKTLFYGNSDLNPEEFNGLSHRFNKLTGAGNSQNIINGGGTGSDNRSIWLVGWSPRTCFCFVPKGFKGGLEMTPLTGDQVSEKDDGSMLPVYRTKFLFRIGLAVPDWRYVVRICNIDKSNLNSTGTSPSANLPHLMYRAVEAMESTSGVRACFYMSRDMLASLGEQTEDRIHQSTLKAEDVGGIRRPSFQGIPIKRCDALAVDESRVT